MHIFTEILGRGGGIRDVRCSHVSFCWQIFFIWCTEELKLVAQLLVTLSWCLQQGRALFIHAPALILHNKMVLRVFFSRPIYEYFLPSHEWDIRIPCFILLAEGLSVVALQTRSHLEGGCLIEWYYTGYGFLMCSEYYKFNAAQR